MVPGTVARGAESSMSIASGDGGLGSGCGNGVFCRWVEASSSSSAWRGTAEVTPSNMASSSVSSSESTPSAHGIGSTGRSRAVVSGTYEVMLMRTRLVPSSDSATGGGNGKLTGVRSGPGRLPSLDTATKSTPEHVTSSSPTG